MENILFRQTFRGFDRRQVLEYIDNLSAQMSRQADDYSDIQKGLEAQIHALSQQLSENQDSLAISRDTAEKLKEELDCLKQDNIELKKQINTYRNIILEKDREIAQIKSDYNRLSGRAQALEIENADWKSKQDEIAACMVEASVRAREIINRATQHAEKTKAEFDANAAGLMEKVADVKVEISRLEQQLEDSFSKLSAAMENMDKASTVIENQVIDYRNKVDKIDRFTYNTQETSTEKPKNPLEEKNRPDIKKTLTDSVLDTITKLLEK